MLPMLTLATFSVCIVAISVVGCVIWRKVRRVENRVDGLEILGDSHGRAPDPRDARHATVHLVRDTPPPQRRTVRRVVYAHRRSIAIGGAAAAAAAVAAVLVVSAIAAPISQAGAQPDKIAAPRVPNIGRRPEVTPAADPTTPHRTAEPDQPGVGGGQVEVDTPSPSSAPTASPSPEPATAASLPATPSLPPGTPKLPAPSVHVRIELR